MENISHSIPNRRSFTSYSNAFTAPHNSVYDDVFGGPPKVGIPTLAPRFEDYAEIFGGFHAYRSSSIPVLHLPSVADDSDLHFQVRSSDFDYAEVFGGFTGFGSAASYEDLVGQSGGRYDSSDEPWSPAQSESLSDKVDPLLASDKNYRLPDGDGHQSLEGIKQFNTYYNKSSEITMESVLNGTCHVTNIGIAPAYTYPSNDKSVPLNEKDELCSMHVTDDINCSKDFSERVAEEKQYDKSLLTTSYSGFATHGYDFNPSEKHGFPSSTVDKPFMTISDISLRTKPSQLPPPSRPPPALAAKNGGCDRSNSIFAASKSYAFERVDGTSPYFFDVEVDVTSAQGVENGNKSFRVKQRGVEKLNEKKDIQAHSKLHLENAMKMEEKTNRTFSLSSTLRGEKMQQPHRIETVGSVPFIEESLRARNSTEPISESQGGKYPNHLAKSSMGTVAWREAKEYFEVMETKNSKEAFEKVEGGDTLKQSMTLDACKHLGTVESEEFHQKQDSMRIKAIKEAPMRDEDRNPLEMTAEDCECGYEHGRMTANNRLSNKKELQEKVIPNKLTCIFNLNKMIPETFQQPGEKLRIDRGVIVEKHEEAVCHEVEAKWKLEEASEKMETEKGFIYAHSRKEKNGNHKENIVTAEYQSRPEEAVVQAETREKVKERIELEENDTQHREGREKENVTKLNEIHEQKENEMRVKQAVERRDCGKELHTDVQAKIMVNEQLHCKLEKDKEAGKQEVTEMRLGSCPEHARDDKKQKDLHKCELMKDRSGDSLESEANDVGILKAKTEVGNEGDPFEREIELPLYGDAIMQEELRRQSEEIELIQRNGHLKEVNWDLESHVLIEGDRLRVFDEASKCYDEDATEVAGKHNDPLKMEETQAILSVERNGKLNDEPESRVHEPEARMDDPLFNEKINRFGKNKVELQDRNSHCDTNHMSNSPSLLEHVKYLNKGDRGNWNTGVMLDKIAPEIVFGHETETMKRIFTEDERLGKPAAHFIEKENIRDSLAFREPVENGNMMEGASPFVSEHNEDALSSSRNASIRKMEIKEKNENENLAPKDQLLRESLRNETVLEKVRMRKIEEEREWEREREREREKDRMAVDKEALETHTRLYAEARERAAVGRTTAEVRQKAMSEAQERLELASSEARLRAERAAVERATAEARQRAVEKSIAEKAAFDTRERFEKPMSDRFSMFSRSADARQSSLSTDLHHRNTGISNGLRNSYASAHFGAEGESPQRCRARLQRFQRTADRAANALAEKNMRDLLALREREERNRVAETLDTEVRRWSSGKEGNLRALLSTLQYILGPNSGWHPVPLTEVITSAAVKKAYRRATLCVHPDKLQQRGATIQQKYICEKVFDLLKEAWNKFNSEER